LDYRLFFSQKALNDPSEIVGHIAQDDDEAAARFGGALLDHVDLLGRFPRMGNTVCGCVSWSAARFSLLPNR
jgi:plasmid stabilization system protein ParE